MMRFFVIRDVSLYSDNVIYEIGYIVLVIFPQYLAFIFFLYSHWCTIRQVTHLHFSIVFHIVCDFAAYDSAFC